MKLCYSPVIHKEVHRKDTNLFELEQSLLIALTKFQQPDVDADSPSIIYDFVKYGIKLADRYGAVDQKGAQEVVLLDLFNKLLTAAVDPLRPFTFRQNCANEIFRPLSKLLTFYDDSIHGKQTVNELIYNMRALLNCSDW